MPCNPQDINVNPPALQGSDVNLGEAPSTFDFGLGVPGGFPPDLSAIFDSISAILPSGTIKPHLNTNSDHSIFDAVMDLLNKILPFLSIYKFFMPILNIIVCIIEVLCAIPNPFKLIRAIRRLFRNCLPDFLALFPVFALVAMIISLVLIIVALIEYLVSEIIFVVNQLVENVNLLAKIIKRNDIHGALSIQQKIGSLLCYLQNLFVIFGVLGVIFQIIKSLFNFPTSFPPCDDGDTSDAGCCTPEVCPAFIRDQEEFNGTHGQLQYFNDVSINSGLGFNYPVRNSSWQFFDNTLPDGKSFLNIILPFDVDPKLGFSFFPQGIIYNANTNIRKVPYTVDMRFFYNPVLFGINNDHKGARFVRVNNCIVDRVPTAQEIGYNGDFVGPSIGVLSLIGGQVVEDDNVTPVLKNGTQASLTSLIHFDPIHASEPVKAGQVRLDNISYTFKINHEVLLEHTMITLGCVPSVGLDRGLINGSFGQGRSLAGIEFPDAEATRVCLTAALDSIRSDISIEKLADFQSFTTSCLNGLKTQSLTALKALIGVGFDPNTSKYSITPSVQFTTFAIKVAVTLNDVNGINLCTKLPAETVADIQEKITATIDFGEISAFKYNTADSTFEALITSTKEGGGKLSVKYDNSFIRSTSVPANLNLPATTAITSVAYQFVAASTLVATVSGTLVDGTENAGTVRRDEGDSAREGITE